MIKRNTISEGLMRVLRPSRRLMTLYFLYLLIGILVGILPWYIPLVIFVPELTSLLTILILAVVVPLALWIPGYYNSLVYELRERELETREGVWFRKISIIPYSRITNVDIVQGPLSRLLKIHTIKVQTAGYSGQTRRAEARLLGMENPEEVKEMILSKIGVACPEAEGAPGGEDLGDLLREVRRIRELLESHLS